VVRLPSCRFHTDAHYDEVLFGAWCMAGPMREFVSRHGAAARVRGRRSGRVSIRSSRCSAGSGQLRYDRERYVAAAATVFLGFELERPAEVRERFGIGSGQARGSLDRQRHARER